jgi:VanZ family protein
MSAPDDSKPSAAWAWFWAAAWAAIVWGLGGDDLSMDSTSRFLGPLIDWLLPDISQEASELIQFYIRKTVHLAEYALLAVLIMRGLLAGGRPGFSRMALVAIVLASAFAAADETRQSLSATREGSAWDVAIDGTGAAVGVGLLLWIRIGLPWFGQRIGPPSPGTAVSNEDTSTGTAE